MHQYLNLKLPSSFYVIEKGGCSQQTYYSVKSILLQWAMFHWLTRAGSDYRVEQEMLGLWLCLKNFSFFFFLILRRRRGAINAKQLTYLEQYKPSKLLKEKPANNCCVQWCYENTDQLSVYFKLNFWQLEVTIKLKEFHELV